MCERGGGGSSPSQLVLGLEQEVYKLPRSPVWREACFPLGAHDLVDKPSVIKHPLPQNQRDPSALILYLFPLFLIPSISSRYTVSP